MRSYKNIKKSKHCQRGNSSQVSMVSSKQDYLMGCYLTNESKHVADKSSRFNCIIFIITFAQSKIKIFKFNDKPRSCIILCCLSKDINLIMLAYLPFANSNKTNIQRSGEKKEDTLPLKMINKVAEPA